MKTQIVKVAKNAKLVIGKNGPAILTGFAVAGLVGVVVSAIHDTPKAMVVLEERRAEELDKDEEFIDFTKWGIVKETWKCYIPTIAITSFTMACIIYAQTENTRRMAALASLYGLSETTLREYKDKVVETFGEKKAQDVKDKVAKEKVKKNPVDESHVEYTGHGQTLCYDVMSGRYFRSDIEHIKRALNSASRKLMSEMYITLNEVYYEMDLSGNGIGELVGWNIDEVGSGLIEGDFSSQLTDDGTPCLVLDFVNHPTTEKPF